MLNSTAFSLSHKIILITGASSGIGRSLAIEASSCGATVLICGRSVERLEATFKELNVSLGQIHKKIVFDLSDEAEASKIAENLNNLDGVVFTAGSDLIQPFSFASSNHLKTVMDDNFTGHALFLQKLVKGKKINSKASLIFISSVNGTSIGSKGHSLYAAAKGAINGLVRVLANELARKKIRVNAVAPGMVETGLMKHNAEVVSSDELEAHKKHYPLGFGRPEDVAYLCIYLLSNASAWMTGQTITIDGGLTINR